MPTSGRLELAKTIARELRKRERRNVVAIGLYGSVSRGEDRTHSDVDLILIVRSKRFRKTMDVRDGVLVSILQVTQEEAEDEVRGDRWNLPEALSGWQSMRALYDPTHLLLRLKRRAQRPTGRQFQAAARGGFLGAYEDYGKLRNALEAGDAEEAREMSIWFSEGAAMILLCLDRRVVRTGRRLFPELRTRGALGSAICRLRYEHMSLRETKRIAGSVWSALLRRAQRQRLTLPDLP